MGNEKAICKLLYRLYAFKGRRVRRIIKSIAARLENGQMYSLTLRRIYRDYHQIEIGLYSYGGCFDEGRIGAFTKIGRYCSFAEGVCIFNRNHPLEFMSMHPFFYNSAFGYVEREMVSRRRLEIGNDVWVGQGAIILPSVSKIGDGAVIGAAAVVTRDVPDFAVVVGNPARIVKYRFSAEDRHKIKRSQWWNKDIEQLSNYINSLHSLAVESFEDNEIRVS